MSTDKHAQAWGDMMNVASPRVTFTRGEMEWLARLLEHVHGRGIIGTASLESFSQVYVKVLKASQ